MHWLMEGLDIPSLMAEAKLTGVSLAVIRAGEIEALEAYGYADLAAQKRASPSTVFEVASLGKPVFAYAVLKLADAGLLDLDEPLRALAPDFIEADGRAETITARHVLGHTSGLPNWRSAERPLRCHFVPGARFSYSGEGYLYLQRAAERLTGEPLDALTRRLVFAPLGMNGSSYDGAALPSVDMAVPHDQAGQSLPKARRTPNAASSLHSTAQDYARFLQAVLGGEGLSVETARQWLQPNRRTPTPFFAALDPTGDPPLHPTVAWGLGWGVEGDSGVFFHWGSNPGFKSFILGSVPERSALVVLSTGPAELALGPALTAALLPGRRPCMDWFGV
ncbi:MAG TPA: serine hydrolase domain-containing protein [Caulobacteraceae bacterium]